MASWKAKFVDRFYYKRIVQRNVVLASKWFHRGGLWRIFGLVLHQINQRRYSCEIYPDVSIGQNFYMPHCIGVVIGKTATIGNDVTIFPNVVIGAKHSVGQDRLTGRRHANIGNNVLIGANTVILGAITIGNNVTIAAGSVVDVDVPDSSLVYGHNQIKPIKSPTQKND